MTMKPADEARKYCDDNYVKPARAKGEKIISIRAGDVHKALGFTNRIPSVCGAIGTKLFEKECNLQLIRIEGPAQSTTTTFIFELL